MPDSKAQGNFLIKNIAEFSARTNSKHLTGFVFAGNDHIEVGTTKGMCSRSFQRQNLYADVQIATVPKFSRRRSRNDIRRLLLAEKGTGPWPPSREPLLKKLKITAKPSVSRPPSASARGTSIAGSPSTVESSSESEPDAGGSDYETGSEEEVEPEEPSPLQPNRPVDPIKAVEYDAVQAVWAKRRIILSGAVIRTALSDYWIVMKGIRDKWKAEVAVLQQAMEKKEKAKVIEYERRTANQRKLLESCIHLTLKHGHPDIIEKYVNAPVDFFQSLLFRVALHVHGMIPKSPGARPTTFSCKAHTPRPSRARSAVVIPRVAGYLGFWSAAYAEYLPPMGLRLLETISSTSESLYTFQHDSRTQYAHMIHVIRSCS